MEVTFNIISDQADIHHNDDKFMETGKVNYHFLNSYIGNIVIKSALVITAISAVVLTPAALALLPVVGLTIPILIGIGVGLIVINIVLIRKQLLFEISLIYTVFTTKHWATRIDDHLILGAIPLEHHGKWLKQQGVNVLVSMVEPFELQAGLVRPLKDIERKHIHAQDFFGVPVEQIKEGVDFFKEKIDAKETVYVHCKAGRGRSTAIVLAYLLTYGLGEQKFKDYDEAYAYVKQLRPQINLNPRQKATVVEYWNQYCQ